MHTTDANTQELNPSNSFDTQDDSVFAGAEPLQAESSPAEGATDDSTLSIIRDVVKDKTSSEAASPAEGQTDAGLKPEVSADKKEPDNENYSDVPFNKHPRFRELLAERNNFKVDATRYQQVETFLQTNGLNAQEAAEGLTIMAAMKSDPQKAWDMLRPHVQKLLVAAGEVLPDDLAQRVQRGELSQEAAFEVSRSRAKVQTVEANQTFRQQQEESRAQQEHGRRLYDAATSWEADRRRKDPNFQAKFVSLQKEVLFLQSSEGKPSTPEGVLDQLERAYKAVVPPAPTASAAPKPRSTSRPTSVGQSPSNAHPAPQSTLDIIRAARAR